MKIAFFTDSYTPQKNGVTTSVDSLKQALEKRGHTVIVVAPKYPDYSSTKTVIRLPSFQVEKSSESRFALYFPAKSLRQALTIDCDIIHGHSGGPITLLGWDVARRKNVPYVFTYHTLWNKYVHYFLKGKLITPKMMEQATKIFSNMSSVIIAPSSRIKKELSSYGVRKTVHVVPSGIDITLFKGDKSNYLHSLLEIEPQKKILLSVSRLGKEKSVDFLLHSFKEIHKKNPDTALVIVGEGSEKIELKQLAKKLDIQKAVYFTGALEYEDTIKAYKSADIFVFASKTETQGIVILEALASALPVVTLNISPFNEIIKTKQNGILTSFNKHAFAKAVLTVLSDKTLEKTIVKGAQETANTHSIDTMCDHLERIYDDLLKNPEENKVEIKHSLWIYIKRRVFLN